MAEKTLQMISHEVCNGGQWLIGIPLLKRKPGLFAGTVGVRRLLKLFEKYNIKTTWFIPGHSLETFPEECAMIRDAGHEMYIKSSSTRLQKGTIC